MGYNALPVSTKKQLDHFSNMKQGSFSNSFFLKNVNNYPVTQLGFYQLVAICKDLVLAVLQIYNHVIYMLALKFFYDLNIEKNEKGHTK